MSPAQIGAQEHSFATCPKAKTKTAPRSHCSSQRPQRQARSEARLLLGLGSWDQTLSKCPIQGSIFYAQVVTLTVRTKKLPEHEIRTWVKHHQSIIATAGTLATHIYVNHLHGRQERRRLLQTPSPKDVHSHTEKLSMINCGSHGPQGRHTPYSLSPMRESMLLVKGTRRAMVTGISFSKHTEPRTFQCSS